MLAHDEAPWTFEAYLEWEAKQPEKWELIGGRPVLRSARWGIDGLDAVIELSPISVALPLSEIYRGVEFESSTDA